MIKKILSSKGLQQSILLTGGNLTATFFSALGLMLISRQLGPDLFAEFTVGYSLMIIIVRLQGLGLNVAIQKIAGKYFDQENTYQKLNKLFQLTTGINLALIVSSLLVSSIISWPIANLLHLDNKAIILGSFLFANLILFFEYLTTIFQIVHKFTKSVIMMLIQSVLKFATALIFFLMAQKNVLLTFYSFYLTPIISIGFAFINLPEKIKILPLRRSVNLEKQIFNVAKHSAILMATAGLIDYIDVLFVKRFTTDFETGIYGGVAQIATAVALIGFSLASVLNARVARYHHKEHLSAFIKKALSLAALALIGYLIFLPLTNLSILITIGAQYLAGARVLKVMMAASFLTVALTPFQALFYSFEESWYFSVSGLIQILLVVGGNLIFVPIYGMSASAWIRLISRVVLFLFTLITSLSLYHRKYSNKVDPELAL